METDDFNSYTNALGNVCKAVKDLIDAVVEACRQFVLGARKIFDSFFDTLYRWVATPVEYHRMKYSKKRRTRKKWRDILHRRLMALLAELKGEE